jgi:hypothetical protein
MFDVSQVSGLDLSDANVRTQIANAYIALDEQAKAIKAQQDILRDLIIQTGCDRLAGDLSDVQVYLSQRKVIDEDKLQRIFAITAEQLKAFNACKKDGGSFEVVKIVDKK